MRSTLAALRYLAYHAPERSAIRWTGGHLSYRELFDLAHTIGGALERRGVRVLALAADNGPEWIAVDFAAQMAGSVLVPIPSFFSAEQTRHALADSGADALIIDAESLLRVAPQAAELETFDGPRARLHLLRTAEAGHDARLASDTAKISYTSGTTGRPKGACLTQRAMDEVAQSLWSATAELDLARHLCLLPLATLLENVAGVYAALRNGAEIATPRLQEVGLRGSTGVDTERFLGCLRQHEPHSIILLPQTLLALVTALEHGHTAPESLRFAAVGGARVSRVLLERADRLGLPVYEGYGLTETASVVTLNTPAARRVGSVGRPLAHARIRIDADAEIHVAGVTMSGYVGASESVPQEIATGDLGRIDSDGFLHVTGRRKSMFVTSFGRNVSPDWVETELAREPPIAQAAVFGEARPWNVAVIVPSPAAPADDIQGAVDAINAELPDYAQVADWVRADEPFTAANGLLTANGRNRRAAIWERYRYRIDACYHDVVSHSEQSRGVIA